MDALHFFKAVAKSDRLELMVWSSDRIPPLVLFRFAGELILTENPGKAKQYLVIKKIIHNFKIQILRMKRNAETELIIA